MVWIGHLLIFFGVVGSILGLVYYTPNLLDCLYVEHEHQVRAVVIEVLLIIWLIATLYYGRMFVAAH